MKYGKTYLKYLVPAIFIIIAMLVIGVYFNFGKRETFHQYKHREMMAMRKKLREDYDNFDIKEYEKLGLFQPSEDKNEVPSKAGLDTFIPKKTSELVAYCDETFQDACITY